MADSDQRDDHDHGTAASAAATGQSLRVLSANIQAGSSTRGYQDYVTRSWSHVLPAGNKRGAAN